MALSAFELCEETFGMSKDDLESIIAFLRSAESWQMSHSDVEKLVRAEELTSTPSMGSALHRQAIAAPRCWRSRRTARAL